MRDFKKLLIWQLGMDIVDKVYEIVPLFPLEEKYGLKSERLEMVRREQKMIVKFIEKLEA